MKAFSLPVFWLDKFHLPAVLGMLGLLTFPK